MRLKDKIAIITGASGGIGAAIARAYATEDIAGVAVYLASEESKTVHGLDLIVDGGVAAVQ